MSPIGRDGTLNDRIVHARRQYCAWTAEDQVSIWRIRRPCARSIIPRKLVLTGQISKGSSGVAIFRFLFRLVLSTFL